MKSFCVEESKVDITSALLALYIPFHHCLCVPRLSLRLASDISPYIVLGSPLLKAPLLKRLFVHTS